MIDQEYVRDGIEILSTVNEDGRDFTPLPRPKGLRRMKEGSCFYNVMHTMLTHEDPRYAEGLAGLRGLGYVHHAWNVDARGYAIDRTWDYRPDGHYRGIVWSHEDAAKTVVEAGLMGVPLLGY